MKLWRRWARIETDEFAAQLFIYCSFIERSNERSHKTPQRRDAETPKKRRQRKQEAHQDFSAPSAPPRLGVEGF